jgi:hypothetical protein
MYTNNLYIAQNNNNNIYNIKTLLLNGSYNINNSNDCIIYNQIKVPNQNEHANISDINLINIPKPLKFKIKCNNYKDITYRVVDLRNLDIKINGDIHNEDLIVDITYLDDGEYYLELLNNNIQCKNKQTYFIILSDPQIPQIKDSKIVNNHLEILWYLDKPQHNNNYFIIETSLNDNFNENTRKKTISINNTINFNGRIKVDGNKGYYRIINVNKFITKNNDIIEVKSYTNKIKF